MSSMQPPSEPQDPSVSRRRFLARAGVTLGAVPLISLVQVEDAAASPPPTVFDVTSYGAQGDGTTDDSNAIQAAIDAANSIGGGTIVFPTGIFLITRALTIYSNIVFRGAGMRATVIKKGYRSFAYPMLMSPGFDPPVGDPTAIHTWSLQNISLDGNRDAGALGNGVQIYSNAFSMFNVSVYNCGDRGIFSAFTLTEPLDGHSMEAQLVNVWVHHCTGGGIYWDGPRDSHWVNVVVYKCGPPVSSGSTTKGVEIHNRGNGMGMTNCHVWGLNHAIAWYIDCDGPSLMNCSGEGAEQTQIVVVGNDSVIVGGKFYAARPGNQTVGIEIGSTASSYATYGTFVHTKVVNCELGALKFTHDGGIGRYLLSVWQTAGNAVVVRQGAHMEQSNRLDIQVSGGAKYGDLGGLRPVTLQGDTLATGMVEMRGDVRAGTPTSKLGLFGSTPQPRSTGWAVGSVPDMRTIDSSADLTQVRAVLATLVRELERYGLLAAQSSAKTKSLRGFAQRG
jgi:hypothetical protein